MEDRLMVSVSGVRGTVGTTLTPQVALQFGLAFGTMLVSGGASQGSAPAGKTVVIGRDTRPSGPMIQSAVTAGLLACGVHVVDLGVVSTPGVGFMTKTLGADGAVVITASHNPSQYNGIKFLQPSGCAVTADTAETLKAVWQGGQFTLHGTEGPGQVTRNGTTHGRHVDAVCGITDVNLIASRRFKIVLDSINGAGCVVTPMLLGRLGCETAHINADPTGRFAHEPEPIEKNLAQLCQAVRKHKAAVGFAQDPDADRLVVVDEQGRFIGEEYTLALAAAFVLSKRKGKIATNLTTSRMVDDIAAAAGTSVVRSPTGEANVVQAMFREGCILGGEGNGGVIEPRIVPVRNSLVGIAMILQYMAETGRTVSELAGAIPSYALIKTKFPCPAGAAPKVVAEAKKLFASTAGAKFDEQDGLRVDLPEGWVNVRASNTEPIMRIMAEAKEARVAQELVDKVRAVADKVIASNK